METQPKPTALRILALSAQSQGANDYALVRAFRRAGHSVQVVPSENYIPRWDGKRLRLLRRLLQPMLVTEYNRRVLHVAMHLRPDLLFVFKGQYLTMETLEMLRGIGTIAIQFFPDTGFADHGPYLPKAIGCYDWVFTTKPTGVSDLKIKYGIDAASFIPHAFDPETHAPVLMSSLDRSIYQCDVSFIGNTSQKKRDILEFVRQELPDIRFKIWGPAEWRQYPFLKESYQGSEVWGREYAKAILGSKINLGLLFEGGPSAPAGDLITSRTFHIPAVGGFMLHERTDEATHYFADGKESAYYSDPVDLVKKIRYYLENSSERQAISEAGRERCLSSPYSTDDRVKELLAKYYELRLSCNIPEHGCN